jgi:gas vesicle protein
MSLAAYRSSSFKLLPTMENKNINGKLASALLLGAGIGVAIGILFAPDRGSVTRKKLFAGSEDFKDAVKEKFNTLLNELQTEVKEVEAKANQLVENGAIKADKFKVS